MHPAVSAARDELRCTLTSGDSFYDIILSEMDIVECVLDSEMFSEAFRGLFKIL